MEVLLVMHLKAVYWQYMVQLVVETDPKLSASFRMKTFLVSFSKETLKLDLFQEQTQIAQSTIPN